MGTRIDLTELPAITELLMEVSRTATVHPLKGVMGQPATHEQIWPSKEHSASLLMSVWLDATVALGQSIYFNLSKMERS